MKKLLILLCLWVTPALAQPAYPPLETINQAYVARAVVLDVDFPLGATRALFIGSAAACTLAVILAGDTVAISFTNVQIGQFLPIRAKRVVSAGTNCTNILALY